MRPQLWRTWWLMVALGACAGWIQAFAQPPEAPIRVGTGGVTQPALTPPPRAVLSGRLHKGGVRHGYVINGAAAATMPPGAPRSSRMPPDFGIVYHLVERSEAIRQLSIERDCS